MDGQARKLKMIAEMNETPLQQHVLTLLLKEGMSADETSLYLMQAAVLIPQLLEMDENRAAHQRLLRMLEELPVLRPDLQISALMGIHQASTENDITEMTDEMTGITSLPELALLIADNLLGVLNRG